MGPESMPIKRQPWRDYLAQARLKPEYLANANLQPASEAARASARQNDKSIRLFAELDGKS